MTPEAQRRAITSVTGVYRNYTGDLNAMHEAEKSLNPPYDNRWGDYLAELDNTTNGHRVHATAAQRAEAFLRTLGLWT